MAASSAGIHNLPNELLLSIFSHMSVSEMAWCAMTCRRWQGLVTTHTSLWKGKFYVSNRSPRECVETQAVMHALPPCLKVNVEPGDSFLLHILYPHMVLSVTHLGIVEECPRLRCNYLATRVDIAGDIFTYRSVIDCEALRKLRILRTRRINAWTTHFYSTDYVVGAALVLCPNITELCVGGETLSADYLDSVQAFGRLRTLQIECPGLEKLTFLRQCSGALEELQLEGCTGLPSREFAKLRQLQNLRLLQLSDCRLEEEDLAAAAKGLARLETLEVHRSVVIRDLSFLRHCGQLRDLCLCDAPCPDALLRVTWAARQLHLRNRQVPARLAVRSVRTVGVAVNVDCVQDAVPILAQLGLSSRCLDYLRPLSHCPLLRHLCCDFVRGPDDPELLNEPRPPKV